MVCYLVRCGLEIEFEGESVAAGGGQGIVVDASQAVARGHGDVGIYGRVLVDEERVFHGELYGQTLVCGRVPSAA